MSWTYDPTNIFARILRGEIPNKTVMDTPHTLVFHDIHPQAPVHVLAIPKGAYVSFDHFAAEASETVAKVCAILGLTGEDGFRAITNAGTHGMQEVPHYHLHILGGRVLGRMLERD
jgi:histidine triad (HIT) family protein